MRETGNDETFKVRENTGPWFADIRRLRWQRLTEFTGTYSRQDGILLGLFKIFLWLTTLSSLYRPIRRYSATWTRRSFAVRGISSVI